MNTFLALQSRSGFYHIYVSQLSHSWSRYSWLQNLRSRNSRSRNSRLGFPGAQTFPPFLVSSTLEFLEKQQKSFSQKTSSVFCLSSSWVAFDCKNWVILFLGITTSQQQYIVQYCYKKLFSTWFVCVCVCVNSGFFLTGVSEHTMYDSGSNIVLQGGNYF